jgi:Uma2 family endonuclease
MTTGVRAMLKQAKAIPSVAPPAMSYQEFLELGNENPHMEWVNGEVVEMSPITVTHNDLTLFLLRVLGQWVEWFGLGQLKHDPFQMKTGPTLPGRAPDVLFVSHRNAARLKPTYLAGPADLVIEVISEGSRSVDRGEKYFEYEEGGVKEYWLIDPIRKQAEFYRLGRDRLYHLVPLAEDGVLHSNVIKGLWIKESWLWQKPLPTLRYVMEQWKLQ